MAKKKVARSLTVVRRGFDIERTLYDDMRVSALRMGQYPKDWLADAIRIHLHKLKRLERDAKKASEAA